MSYLCHKVNCGKVKSDILYLCMLNKTNKKMKKILTLVSLFTSFVFVSNAQCPANDSTEMGDKTSSDVYYNFTNHGFQTVSNTNWHLAFATRTFAGQQTNPAQTAAIRVNSAGNGTVLKKLPAANAANWRTIDTAGLYALPQLIDSDSTWNLSAFTTGYKSSDPFNFQWGSYNMTSHHVDGSSVYVLYNPTGGWYKKVFVKQLHYDTMWDVIISDLDNSDSVNLKINKSAYKTKLFVYYDAANNALIDREPAKTTWDLVWTKYSKWLNAGPGGMVLYSLAGVISNPAVTVEQNNGKKCNEVWLSNKTSTVDPSMTAIGYDWKVFNNTTMVYDIPDNIVYFVKAQNGKTYKMTFKKFQGGTLGRSTFNFYEATLGIKDLEGNSGVSIYPNPSSGMLTVEAEGTINNVSVIDMQGKTVYNTNEGVLDLSGLANGIYVITVNTSEGVYHQHIIKE